MYATNILHFEPISFYFSVSVYGSVCLSTYLYLYLSLSLSLSLCLSLSLSLSISLSLYLSLSLYPSFLNPTDCFQ